MKPPVNRNVGAQTPIFGIDGQEIEALRVLENTVWMYIHEDASLGDLISAANAITTLRRKRKAN